MYTKDIDYEIKDLFKGQSVLTGYPRVDLLLKQNTKLKQKLGIEESQKVLLYAPGEVV